VLVAIGEGRRQILGVEMANRESSMSRKDFLLALKAEVSEIFCFGPV
jgi:transposase-like protein